MKRIVGKVVGYVVIRVVIYWDINLYIGCFFWNMKGGCRLDFDLNVGFYLIVVFIEMVFYFEYFVRNIGS